MDQLESQLLEKSICQILLDNELEVFIVADQNSRIVFWNAAAEIMFGYTREHALGHHIHQLIAPESVQERANDGFAHFRNTGAGPLINTVVEIEAVHRNGHLFPVEISLSATLVAGKWFSQAMIRSIGRRKEIEAEMQRLTITDPLTGIHNRESMFANGKRELSRAIRYGLSLSIIVLDIDQLKEINEKSGHYAGDQAIKALADLLKKNCRHSDILGRLSGGVILLLLPETEVSMALMVAEKWRLAITEVQFSVDATNIRFSSSIGVSCLENEDRFEVLLNKVEANLQQAKISGGNAVAGDD